MTVVFVGVGNRYRRDDSAGILAAEQLRARAPRSARVLERGGDLAALIDDWSQGDAVVLIDATSTGAPAGTVRRFDAIEGPLPATFARGSTHAFGVAEAVELARVLGKLPAKLVVYGIEGSDFAAGEGVGAEVEASVAVVVERALSEAVDRA